jgi:Fur family transcriptional regulator, ferric uptake regulator
VERHTRQRTAIRDALEHAGRPLSPPEILNLAKGRVKALGLATVYRNIRAMIESGEIVQVELPGDSPRYERAGKHHHHHFHCRTCGKVFEAEGCPTGLATLVPGGFELEGHEILLFGRCRACVNP